MEQLDLLRRFGSGPLEPCTAGTEVERVVMFSDSCTSFTQGVCFRPEDTILNAWIAGVEQPVAAIDGADMMALIIGGSRRSVFGSEGERMLANKNKAMLAELQWTALVGRDASRLRGQQELARPDPPGSLEHVTCAQKWLGITARYQGVLAQTGNGLFYRNPDAAHSLKGALAGLRQAWEELNVAGCV